jgi:hypothetical protein
MDDSLMWLRLFGGGFGTGVDTAAVIAFVVFGVVSFLGPALGYRPGRSGGVTASLFLLIGYVAVSLVQLGVQWMQVLDRVGTGGPMMGGGRGESSIHYLFLFAMLKMLLFLAAMMSFALGVGSYRLPTKRRDDDEDDDSVDVAKWRDR